MHSSCRQFLAMRNDCWCFIWTARSWNHGWTWIDSDQLHSIDKIQPEGPPRSLWPWRLGTFKDIAHMFYNILKTNRKRKLHCKARRGKSIVDCRLTNPETLTSESESIPHIASSGWWQNVATDVILLHDKQDIRQEKKHIAGEEEGCPLILTKHGVWCLVSWQEFKQASILRDGLGK